MRKPLQVIYFLKNLSTGIIAPVLVLALLAHGATLRTLPLLLGAFSLTVIVAEFPTGLFADLYGRKTAFVTAMVFSAASYGLILLASTQAVLLLALVFNGLARAFSSGSIDALAVETAAPGTPLVKITARLSVLESAGLAGGALFGGVLAGFGKGYSVNLLVNAALSLLLLLLTLACAREPRHEQPAQPCAKRFDGLKSQVRLSLSFLASGGLVRTVFTLAAVTGMVLFSLETYWQPALTALTAPAWLLGTVTGAGFGFVMLGSKLAEWALLRKPSAAAGVLLLHKAVMGACLALLMFMRSTPAFVTVYMLLYTFIGGGSVAENTILNREAPSRQRASILSLFSFATQAGGLFASLCGYWVSTLTDYRVSWAVFGGFMLLSAGLLALRAARAQPRKHAKSMAREKSGTTTGTV